MNSGGCSAGLWKGEGKKMFDDWEMTEAEKIRMYRENYRRFGLSIFESFEEYMSDKEEDDGEH